MCPNCVTPWKCNGPHIPETFAPQIKKLMDQGAETLYVALLFDPKEFNLKYNLKYREDLAQNAYDAVLEQLDDRYPDPFEDVNID